MKRHPILTGHAKNLRKDQTFAEARLWDIVRGGILSGFKFRRQHEIEPYGVDCCGLSVKLIVELDGEAHLGRKSQGRARDEYLTQLGFEILRFENCDVFYEENRVVERIIEACKRRSTEKT